MKFSLGFLQPKSIVNRLTAWYTIALFIIFYLATTFLYFSLSSILAAEDNAVLRDRVEAITTIIKENKDPLLALRRRVELEWASRRAEKIYIKIAGPGEHGQALVISPRMKSELESEIIPSLTVQNVPATRLNGKRVETKDGNTFLGVAKNIESDNPQLNGANLYAVLDLTSENEILTRYKEAFIGVLFVAIVISGMIGFRLAKLSFEPVTEVANTARRIRAASLHERISESNLPTELKNLAETINEMLDHLEEAFGRLSRFSADLAHEFRTPINNMQGEIEVAIRGNRTNEEYRDVLVSVLEETHRISKMIDSLLFLARSENPNAQVKYESFNLRDEILNICDFYEASAEEEGIRLETDIPSDIFLRAERTLFQRAVTNLLSNSINNTPRDGVVRIKAFQNGKYVQLTVEDTGKGIPREDLPLVFDRFFRSDPSRTATKLGGFGLGLTIVKSVMRLHHGRVEIQSELNKGTKVTLEFPATALPG